MPTISDNFTVSDHDNYIQVIDQSTPTIILSVWSQQGRSGDNDLFSADVFVHGRTAEWVIDNFQPGNPIHITGELVSEINHTDQGSYLNNEILADDISFVPKDRSAQTAAQQNGRDQRQTQQGQGQQNRGRGQATQSQPSTPAPQTRGNQGGQNRQGNQNAQNGNQPAGGNRPTSTAPEPRDR